MTAHSPSQEMLLAYKFDGDSSASDRLALEVTVGIEVDENAAVGGGRKGGLNVGIEEGAEKFDERGEVSARSQ